MKTKNIILTVAVCIIVLILVNNNCSYSKSSSKSSDSQVQKIADSVEDINLKVEKLNKEVDGLKTELNTLKAGGEGVQEAVKSKTKPVGAGLKVGTINIRRIFQESKKGADYRKEATAEQDRIVAELDRLSKEIEAEKAGLKTLKEGSDDYMTSAKGLFEKQANYQARQEFYKQKMEMKDQLWTREVYQDIIRMAGEVAKEKGLDLVFKDDEIDFTEPDVSELGLNIRTQKLLYAGGCLDITDEVKTRLDAKK
jgi:Skp family chaperone for outer membrane proteins